jgi:hypothetical protein
MGVVMLKFVPRFAFATAVMAAAALVSFAPAANAVSYSTVGVPMVTGIGAQGSYVPSVYDQLTLDPNTGTFTTPGTINLNWVTFTDANNSDIAHFVTGTVHEDVTLNGFTVNVAVPYTVDINASDTLNLVGGGVYSFGAWTLTLLSYGPVSIYQAGTYSGWFEGLVSPLSTALTTPLPAALPLFATGLGAMGLFGWRRKRKNAAAVAVA